ncbi:hypothetical protein BJ742DRAFT_910150 [Cladochytrium replicatum]|nr:hypothetical protein BJ742DRAFT_910150 [Cladochytrium replicatum]
MSDTSTNRSSIPSSPPLKSRLLPFLREAEEFNPGHVYQVGNSNNNNDSRLCWNCNQPGHFATNCPRTHQGQSRMGSWKGQGRSGGGALEEAATAMEEVEEVVVEDEAATASGTAKLGTGIQAVGVGKVRLLVSGEGFEREIELSKVYFTPEGLDNLMSWKELRHHGLTMHGEGDSINILMNGEKVMSFEFSAQAQLFELDIRYEPFGFRIWDPERKVIVRSKSVVCDESRSWEDRMNTNSLELVSLLPQIQRSTIDFDCDTDSESDNDSNSDNDNEDVPSNGHGGERTSSSNKGARMNKNLPPSMIDDADNETDVEE